MLIIILGSQIIWTDKIFDNDAVDITCGIYVQLKDLELDGIARSQESRESVVNLLETAEECFVE